MKALIHVGLGHCDIVLETSRDRLVHLVNDTEGRITVRDRINYDPDSKKVIYLVESLVLIEHLAVDGHEMLDAPVKCSFYSRIFNVF